MAGNGSWTIISNDYKQILDSNMNEAFSIGLIDDNMYTWKVVIIGPKDTPYESGIYEAEMIFPLNYPQAPPTFRFITPMWHPNIDKDGNVCISILHKAGEDEFGYEELSERWLPSRSARIIIMSILALLNLPNIESSFNIEASQQLRNDPEGYKKKVRKYAQKSLESA